MASNNRKKLIDIIKILYEKTDEDHALNTYEIIEELELLGHDKTDRKTIESTVKFLTEELDFDIEKEKSTPNRYRWISRNFEIAELKLLVDAVQSSRFISEKRSRDIIEKLKKLTSNSKAAELDRQIITPTTFKRNSNIVLYSIDTINAAIKNNLKIRFIMVDYDLDKKEVPRYEGRIHETSPYALLWNNDYYYMLGTPSDRDEDSAQIRTYRIDRIQKCELTDIPSEPAPSNFKLSKYQSRVFDMFTGKDAEICLDCKKPYLMNYLVDRFGKDFKVTERREDGSFLADVSVDTSPTFYAWIFQFGGDIKITSPEWVCADFKQMLVDQLND